MEISPRKLSKRAQEPVDEWLQTEGYFRKHAPKDPTCLFRAVSEQVYMTQYYHIRVRKKCVEFMRKMKHLFVENITIPFDDYLEQMACFTEWGGVNEIQAMSLLFEREFIIFNGQKQTRHAVTNNGFKDTIYLCHTPQKQYDTIYTRDVVATAAYCQSMVYQVLYKDVFHMANIETTVHKMLHDRTATFRHDKFFLKGNMEMRDQLTAEIYSKVESGNDKIEDTQLIVRNVPPFPYRVAKALDPNIYRNTDFDIWHEIRREVKNAGWTKHNSHELQIGGRCLVEIEFNEEEFDKANNNNIYVSTLEKDTNGNDNMKALQKKGKDLYGYIQEMSKNQGPVLVFIEELGEKRIVPYCALKPLPLRKNKQNSWIPVCKRNVLLDSNQKWKKTYSPNLRKIKQPVSNGNGLSNNIDKNEGNDNNVNNVNRNNFQWREESLKVDNQQSYDKYGSKNCLDYSGDKYSSRMVLDNTQASAVDIAKQEKGEPVPHNPVDNMICPINCSVQKSVDVNGSDLPLSDPFTLRFFYNLGLEYFHGTNNWNYLTNGQSPGFGQWYQGVSQNEEEIITQQKREDYQRNEHKCANDIKSMQMQKTEVPKGDDGKDPSYSSREKVMEQESINRESPRINRNGLGPRFKKNSDNRYRNVQQVTQPNNQYSHSGSNFKHSKSQEMKSNGTSSQHTRSVPNQVANQDTVNSYQTSYMQPSMYSGLPYYTNEVDAFTNSYYPPNPYFPIPCLAHSDIPDNTSVQPFSPHLCPGLDYAQAYSGLCPPYMCSQPAPYNISPQNMQEHWYAVAGQPHYMQYPPMLPMTADATCNGIAQNINQNIPPQNI
ncbi:uncharacterized protein LOC128886761 [Hylaeus anthracinus]|uniref:uncharacterized protein LOC128886761 n=1 Tax=Hylaeus anthracinus TaxID=313031 RepID=UPI0023B9182C|nr:uncharacterized protein LOC128886761 [Hylaeus anthracinus]